MINKNIDYDILIEAEAVADTYARRKPDCIDIPDIEWLVASDQTRLLLIHTQQRRIWRAILQIISRKSSLWVLTVIG